MHVILLLPSEVLLHTEVTRISVEAENGSFTLLPRHIDFVAALVPGLLLFTDSAGEEQVVAIDGGVLVKCGDAVRIATGRAVRGDNLESLGRVVATEFEALDEHERKARTALARLEAGLVRGALDEQRGYR